MGETFDPAIQSIATATIIDTIPGETLIEVSLGQRDRVRNNTKLYLVRSGQYLGEMVVEESDVNWSVGKLLSTARSGITIQQGDEVRTRLD